VITTERLILRPWAPRDLDPFHAMCSDPRVMATLGPLMTRDETAALIQRCEDRQGATGHCFWAVERRADGALIGWCGAIVGNPELPIAGEIEIGWRIAADEWGKGYAREAAEATLDWVWANLDVDSVAAITSVGNTRSWGLMERLGMVRAPEDDFDHPNVPEGSVLRPHITYRIMRPAAAGGINRPGS
jgi:RimJ/RimL family protein N-acetyltransferase